MAPGMVGLGEPVPDPVGLADHVEAHRPGIDGVRVPRLLRELDAIVGENRVDLIGRGLEHVLKELPGSLSVSSCNELSDGELGRPVDAYEQVTLALGGLHLGDVDVNRRSAQRKNPMGCRLNFWRLGLSPSTSGKREMPCR